MRPLELTLRGFRSYAGEFTFDLRDRRLLGIVGPIGSGKSSLLDAVAYALYGKTPTIASNTHSLINQRADDARVQLVFEVDGQVWKVVRALRRKGLSPHVLTHLAADEPDADVVETFEKEAVVNPKIQELLGLEFDGFCRSVLLAQNQFSTFLRAAPGKRDDVLKGVFGLDLLDRAHGVAKHRLELAALEVKHLAELRERTERARTALPDLRAKAERVEEWAGRLAAAAPAIEAMAKGFEAAKDRAVAAEAALEELGTVRTELPDRRAVEDLLAAAARAGERDRDLGAALSEARERRVEAEAQIAETILEIGDRDMLREARSLLEQAEERARRVEQQRTRLAAAEAEVAIVQQRAATASTARDAAERSLAEASAREQDSRADRDRAQDQLHQAHLSDMAASLRGTLIAGEPCPVCAQAVATLPPAAKAPKLAALEATKAKAQAAAEKAERARARAEADLGRRAQEVEGLAEQLAGAGERRIEATNALEVEDVSLGQARQGLDARLGKGADHGAVLAAREAALREAEERLGQAAAVAKHAEEAVSTAREQAREVEAALGGLAMRIASLSATLGARHEPEATPAGVERGVEHLRGAFEARQAELSAERERGVAEAAEAERRRAEALVELGLAPDTDLSQARIEAATALGEARSELSDLEEVLEEAAALEERSADAVAHHATLQRLAQDLQPARFLRYLLEEERRDLAALGSDHFERLSRGRYRFTDDGTFGVVDLAAADAVRKADSLSGGETFLASLALALGLAEMVARTGGRLDAFFLDEGFGSLDPEHLDLAMDGIEALVTGSGSRLVVVVSHVPAMRDRIEDLIVLDHHPVTGDTVVLAGSSPS